MPLEREDVPLLRLAQKNVAGLGAAVGALAGDAGEHVDGGLSIAPERDVVLRLRHHGAHALEDRQRVMLFGLPVQAADEVLARRGVKAVVVVHPVRAGDGEARRPEAVLHRDKEAGIDLAGAGAPLDRAARAAAEQGKTAGLRQRESAVGFQQHGALGAEAPQKRVVLSLVIVHVFLLQLPLREPSSFKKDNSDKLPRRLHAMCSRRGLFYPRKRERKSMVSCFCGFPKSSCGLPCSQMTPPDM